MTVPNRVGKSFLSLLATLNKQIGERQNIEILGLYDNKKRTVGEKRQSLLDIANGEYLVFIDDDDRIGDTYITDIMHSLLTNPDCDCVVFNSMCTFIKAQPRKVLCKYGIEYEYSTTYTDTWYGKPAHTMVYRSSIAKKHRYANISNGEDTDWVKRACVDIKKQVRIDKVLYYYDYNVSSSETRGPLSASTLQKPTTNLKL